MIMELHLGKAIETSSVTSVFRRVNSEFPLTHLDKLIDMWGGKERRVWLGSLTTTTHYVAYNPITQLPHDIKRSRLVVVVP
jgi:hypothetical protein